MLILPTTVTSDPEAAARQLGIPARSEWLRLTTRAPVPVPGRPLQLRFDVRAGGRDLIAPPQGFEGWTGYSFELFGRVVSGIPTEVTRPYLALSLPVPGHRTLEVWYARVFVPEEHVQVEAVWTQERRQKAITAAGTRWEGKALRKAGDAIRLLEDFGKRSKPGPTADLSDDELEAAMLMAISAEWKRLRQKPTLAQLALYFSEHPTLPRQTDQSLGARVRRARLDLKDLYRRAEPSA